MKLDEALIVVSTRQLVVGLGVRGKDVLGKRNKKGHMTVRLFECIIIGDRTVELHSSISAHQRRLPATELYSLIREITSYCSLFLSTNFVTTEIHRRINLKLVASLQVHLRTQ